MRIAGTEIPEKKQLGIALTYIYGIGRSKSLAILKQAGIPANKKSTDLSTAEVGMLRKIIEEDPMVDGSLSRVITLNIKRLRDIGCYRGTRHMRGLPVRGQRTKTNSRTRRGNVRRTMGSGKHKLEKK